MNTALLKFVKLNVYQLCLQRLFTTQSYVGNLYFMYTMTTNVDNGTALFATYRTIVFAKKSDFFFLLLMSTSAERRGITQQIFAVWVST